MKKKCSIINVLEVFFIEPTSIHFIKEISRRINLAPTSVRVHIADLFKEELIIKKESKPFNGYVSNKENELFLQYKRAYNLLALKKIQKKLIEELQPKVISVIGSYSRGEDIEAGDIDILVISKEKKEVDLEKFELILKRKIRVTTIDPSSKLDENTKKKIMNGFVIYGSFK